MLGKGLHMSVKVEVMFRAVCQRTQNARLGLPWREVHRMPVFRAVEWRGMAELRVRLNKVSPT